MSINTQVHTNKLTEILKALYINPSLGPYLGFKGGTAALFFYELSRFSVDLDFDLLDPTKELFIFEKVKEVLEHFGQLKIVQNKRYTLFFLLCYKEKEDGAQNIKIEINKRNLGSSYELKKYYGITLKVMTQPDMFANKLLAMHNRIGHANRDIFDVWFFLKHHWPINKEIVESQSHMKFDDFIRVCIADLEGLDQRTILSGLGELLTEKQKAWAKKHLIEDTLFFLKLLIQQIF